MNNNFYGSDFITYLKSQKRVSSHTIIAYEKDLNDFLDYLEKEFKVESINNVNHKIIRFWMASILDSGLKARTVNRKISALKTYYKFLLKNCLVSKNPMLKIISPKTEKKLPEFTTEKDIDKVLNNHLFNDDFVGSRNKLIVTLFYTTGIRRAELVALTLNDFDTYNSLIRVLGKGNKQRSIPITHEILEMYKKYLYIRNEKETFTNNVFITEKGQKVYDRLVYEVVKKALGNVTSQQKKSPHVLRHTFATHMLNNGADLNAIKEILGHANLSATQVYTHNSIEKLKKTFKQSHPRSGE